MAPSSPNPRRTPESPTSTSPLLPLDLLAGLLAEQRHLLDDDVHYRHLAPGADTARIEVAA